MIDTGNGPEKLTAAQYKARKRRAEVTYLLASDADAETALRIADEQLRQARLRGDTDAITAAQTAADDARRALRDSTLTYRLRALPRRGDRTYQSLQAEHPPTDADNAKARELLGDPKAKARWHTDTFGPALVAACLIEPAVGSVAELDDLTGDWTDAEWDGLVLAAINLNETRVDVGGLTFS